MQTVYGTLTKTLLKIKGLSEIKVEKIKDAAKKCMVRLPPLEPLNPVFAHSIPVSSEHRIHDGHRTPEHPEGLFPRLHGKQAVELDPLGWLPVKKHQRSLWRIPLWQDSIGTHYGCHGSTP